jgi:chromosomal replication initiator protein
MRPPTTADIAAAVAEEFGMSVRELRSKSNLQEIVLPRQLAMMLTREVPGVVGPRYSLSQIGKYYGGKHHTTIAYAIQRGQALAEDPIVAERLRSIRARLEAPQETPETRTSRGSALLRALGRIEVLLASMLERRAQ